MKPRSHLPQEEFTRLIMVVLDNWVSLSEGDISLLDHVVADEAGQLATLEGSANFVMWDAFEKLGWARRLPFPAIEGIEGGPALFALTDDGREMVPLTLKHYDLRWGTHYRPIQD